MTVSEIDHYRRAIASKLRRLRQEHRRTQARTARLLGVSQNWLSDVELGKGSLSAEQFLLILKSFNVTADYFDPNRGDNPSQVRNALVRLGARHLREMPGLPAAPRLDRPEEAVYEALAWADSPDYLTALAPVLAERAPSLNFSEIRARLATLGCERRLGWALENVHEAMLREEGDRLAPAWKSKYARARGSVRAVLDPWLPAAEASPALDDVLDKDVLSDETIEQLRLASSGISARWSILTRIETDDFSRALRYARAADPA